MRQRIIILTVCAALVASIGCSKVEDAVDKTQKKGVEAVDKVIMDPQRRAEAAKDKMNAALEGMQKDINRATEDASDAVEDAIK